jgi:uncharacterized protein
MRQRDTAETWVLLGPHKGDNDQVLALAEALRTPFRTIQMRYKWFAHLPAVLRQVTISQLEPGAFREIAPPWPSLVLGIGQRSAPVARYIQRASGGRAKTVRLGDPMISHRLFDLVITTTQYAVRDGENVIRLPITVTNELAVHPDRQERQWLKSFARPLRLLVIGGKTSLWCVDESLIMKAAQTLKKRAATEGGSVIAVTSPRTSPKLKSAVEAVLGEDAVADGGFPRYAALLQSADEIHVTGDSVSMLSDAVATRKPVGLIPLEPNATARFVKFVGELRGQPFRMRDLRKFWSDLESRGLVGTIENPCCAALDVSPVDIAVTAVRAALERGSEMIPAPPRPIVPSQPEPEALAL